VVLTSLSARNFRNLQSKPFALDPGLNVIVGENGQGKTNLLEAVYFLATTRSFRTNRIRSLFRFESGTLYVSGTRRHDELDVRMSIGVEAGATRRRELRIEENLAPLHEYVRQLPVIAYSAARLDIVRGGPEERRRFLDRGIAHLQPGYLEALGRYQRVLRQRNALLQSIREGEARASMLDPWDQEFAAAAAVVVRARAKYAEELAEAHARIVVGHRYHVDDLTLSYRPSGFSRDGAPLDDILLDERDRQIRLGYTTIGPHRDELDLERRERAAAEVLSSGETKMTVLFLKFAKIELFEARWGRPPILLFDDVDAELDLGIIERLLAYLRGRTQILATSAKSAIFDTLDVGPHRRHQLEGGRLVSSGNFD
jgi:DNA replication and repair protein RecF